MKSQFKSFNYYFISKNGKQLRGTKFKGTFDNAKELRKYRRGKHRATVILEEINFDDSNCQYSFEELKDQIKEQNIKHKIENMSKSINDVFNKFDKFGKNFKENKYNYSEILKGFSGLLDMYNYNVGIIFTRIFEKSFNFLNIADNVRLNDVCNILIKNHEFDIIYDYSHKNESELNICKSHILLINKKLEIIIDLDFNPNDLDSFGTFCFWYNPISYKKVTELSKIFLNKFIYVTPKRNNINLIIIKNKELGLKNFEIKSTNIDLELSYGSKFLETNETIINKLSDPFGKGIVLLHGEPGTGKSFYVRHLTKLIQDKKIIYVPPSLAEQISSPDFLSFLMDHPKSILVIEDAEKIIMSRETNNSSSQAVQNLLNISDGILGDCLKIQIIATFNTSKDNIDSALLRKGRLIAEHYFDKLSIDDSQKMSSSLGFENTINTPMTLTEIYNQEEKLIRNVHEKKKIGF